MNKKSIILGMTLAWAVGFSNISNATVILFNAIGVVDTTSPGFPPIGNISMDSLELRFTDGKVTDTDDVLGWFGDGGLLFTPTSVDLDYTSLMLSGSIEGTADLAPGFTVVVTDDWTEGNGRFSLTFGGAVLLAGTTNIAAVPIPAAAWLFGSALLGLGVVKRKKA